MHYFIIFPVLEKSLDKRQEVTVSAVLVLRLQIGMQMGMSIWLYLRVKAGLYKCNPPGMQLRAACSQNMSELATTVVSSYD